jgi:hypothetical protein
MEPCNYASNIAYYHSALRICEYDDWNFDIETRRALKRGFVTLAPGSSFMHGSHTDLGTAYDLNAISVIVYAIYNKAIKKFGGKSNILLYLNEEK